MVDVPNSQSPKSADCHDPSCHKIGPHLHLCRQNCGVFQAPVGRKKSTGGFSACEKKTPMGASDDLSLPYVPRSRFLYYILYINYIYICVIYIYIYIYWYINWYLYLYTQRSCLLWELRWQTRMSGYTGYGNWQSHWDIASSSRVLQYP